MFDSRVVRGNTYAARIPTLQQTREDEFKARQIQARREAAIMRRRARQADLPSSTTPPPAEGRAHMFAQTDGYLEKLAEQVFEEDAGTQTEFVEEKEAPVILYHPKPAGVSVHTQIEPHDLFDFDLAVEPVLEVLIGKCLDQSQVEVLEEEELKRLKLQRDRFEEERLALIAESQRLVAATQRRHEEKERRMQQEQERLQRERLVARKIAARTAAKAFIAGLPNVVLKRLEHAGHFQDPVVEQVEHAFLPWLTRKVATSMEDVGEARRLVDDLIMNACTQLKQEQADKLAREAAARAAAIDAEKQRVHEAEQKLISDELEEERIAEERRKQEEETAAALALAVAEGEGDEGDEGDESGQDV
jgi:hypothetical protein